MVGDPRVWVYKDSFLRSTRGEAPGGIITARHCTQVVYLSTLIYQCVFPYQKAVKGGPSFSTTPLDITKQ